MELQIKTKQRRRYIHLRVKEVDIIKEKLIAERERILANHKSTNQSEFYLKKEELSDPIDEACANVQASQELRFKTRENKYLQKVQKQLEKIHDPAFGECNECGEGIGFERLKARPTAEKCVSCKESAEFGERMSIVGRRSKSLGKTIQELGSA